MNTKNVIVYYGEGRGKTSAALGYCIKKAGVGKQAIIVQFLKGKESEELDFIKQLEPQVKLFRFEKSTGVFDELSEEEREEEISNIRNGLNYVRKVSTTGECNILVLDEFLGLIDIGILSIEDVKTFLEGMCEDMKLVLTGRQFPEELKSCVQNIYEIKKIK